jgi:tryptophanase
MRNPDLHERVAQELIIREGFPTYGGLAGRDLEAVARGLWEGLDETYLAYRVAHTAYLAERLLAAGVPIVEPPGGHAVYLDAGRFLPHVPPAQFPGQALVAALYLEAGIRGVEIGSVMFGRTDPATGAHQGPALELVRLAIPRRVYTQSHLDYVAEAIGELYVRRTQIGGLRLTYEQRYLRHFTARFAPLGVEARSAGYAEIA